MTAEALRARSRRPSSRAQQAQDLFSYLEEHGIEVARGRGGRGELHVAGATAGERGRRRAARPDVRRRSTRRSAEDEESRRPARAPASELKQAEADLTVDPSLDSLRLYLRSIGRVPLLTAEEEVLAGQAHRARRHGRQAAHGRGQPAAGRLDRQGLRRARPDAAGPDPGGLARPDPGGREVRLPPRLQVLDLRHLVDPPGRHPRARRQGAHDPDPGPHGRAAEQADPRRTPADPAARPRAERRGARQRARVRRSARCAT